MDEWDFLLKVSNCINNDEYVLLYQLLDVHQDEVTPVIVDSLTMLTVDRDIIKVNIELYKLFMELAHRYIESIGLRGQIRVELIKEILKETEEQYEIQ
jgi:CO dehydrogenase/acetyl-CoA synthase gamma subunit (corrinoid Fe-S protein)